MFAAGASRKMFATVTPRHVVADFGFANCTARRKKRVPGIVSAALARLSDQLKLLLVVIVWMEEAALLPAAFTAMI
jgi:hypothetical protein